MEWFNALPDALQQLLIGAAAEYAGLAGPAIYAAARTRLDARRANKQQAKRYKRRSSAPCKTPCCAPCRC